MTTTHVSDGTRIHTLEDFWQVYADAFGDPYGYFGRSLDALADALAGGPGGPDTTTESSGAITRPPAVGSATQKQSANSNVTSPATTRRAALISRGKVEAARGEYGPTVSNWLVTVFEGRAPGKLLLC
ncbi:barstar family protein [Streptomyces sp. NPDC052236]|uniref:barstar family protein n=1 Tax=Streptomyces sp. NPDC052236 TaxID=3365686 RepID=UPI0037D35E59